MCHFPFIAVVMRDRAPADARSVASLATGRGLGLVPIRPTPGRTLERFAAGASLVATFRVPQCACDWDRTEHEALAGLAADLLGARDVSRVRIGWWCIRKDVESADPSRGSELEVRELALPDLASIVWRPEGTLADTALDVRRAPIPPFPTRTLAQLARGK